MAGEQQLSQGEVDALLHGMGSDSGAADAPVAMAGTAPWPPAYRFGVDARIVHGRMHTLEVINERFAGHLRGRLLTYMGRNADISVGAVQTQKYGDFVRALPVPANINLIQMKPLRGTALFVLDPRLVFLVVDNLFGSDGRYAPRLEGRDFTPTEQRIIKRLLDLVLQSYGSAWQPVHPLEFDHVRSEMHGRLANIVTPDELVITTTFQIEFGTVGGLLSVCIPCSMVEPIKALLSSPLQDEVQVDRRWAGQLARQVQSADVELAARFLTVQSSIGQLLTLKVGDVLPVAIPETVTARINGVPLMECSYGMSQGRYALRVQKMINHHPTPDPSKESDHE